VGEFLDLVFVGGDPLQPAKRGAHREQQVQFGMLHNPRLNKESGLAGVDSSSEPVDDQLPGVVGDRLGLVILGGEGVPVGNKEEARVFVLEFDPVFEDTMIVAKVQSARRAHTRDNAGCIHR